MLWVPSCSKQRSRFSVFETPYVITTQPMLLTQICAFKSSSHCHHKEELTSHHHHHRTNRHTAPGSACTFPLFLCVSISRMEKSNSERILTDKLLAQEQIEAEQLSEQEAWTGSSEAVPGGPTAPLLGDDNHAGKGRSLPGIAGAPATPASASPIGAGAPGAPAVNPASAMQQQQVPGGRTFSPNFAPSDDSGEVELLEARRSVLDNKETPTRKPALSWDIESKRVLMMQVRRS